MINILEKSKCSGCYACAEICPQKCIDMVCDGEGFWYPAVDKTQCIDCGLCEKSCPILSPQDAQSGGISTYATVNKEDSVRTKSSSGGVFTLLASYVLSKNGIVFGASFDKDFNVVHRYIESAEELDLLRGSKYVQSKIANAYSDAKAFLKSDRLVLFSGTPCQIEGLLSYLGKPYDNLITQDIICHGVPSPSVWQKYITHQESKAGGAKVHSVSFRSKNTGWKQYSMSLTFDNGTEYQVEHGNDPMMNAFLKNLCLRPSCYECSFKKESRKSDITLADFWGVKNLLPEMDDDKGTSLVIIQSEKGQQFFDIIKDSTVFKKTEPNASLLYNSSIIKSAHLPKRRKAFMKKVSSDNFAEIQKKYSNPTLTEKIKSFILRVLRKIKKILKLG